MMARTPTSRTASSRSTSTRSTSTRSTSTRSGAKAPTASRSRKQETKKKSTRPAKLRSSATAPPESASAVGPPKQTARAATRKAQAIARASAAARRTATPGEIGTDLVRLCNLGQGDAVVDKWYHQRLVSIEGDGVTTRGLKALAGKYAWWDANHEVHALLATGPFVGHTGFAVRFDISVTPKGGVRTEMSEIAVYTVKEGRIVREEFLYGG